MYCSILHVRAAQRSVGPLKVLQGAMRNSVPKYSAVPSRDADSARTRGSQPPESHDGSIPWAEVQAMLEMAQQALLAKQHASEQMHQENEHNTTLIREISTGKDRAEEDSGTLRAEIEQLIQAKTQLAHEKVELERENATLHTERQLLCEMLCVDPMETNLCQAVESVVEDACRCTELDMEVQLLQDQVQAAHQELELLQQRHHQEQNRWRAQERALLTLLRQAHLESHAGMLDSSTTAADQVSGQFQTVRALHEDRAAAAHGEMVAASVVSTSAADASSAYDTQPRSPVSSLDSLSVEDREWLDAQLAALDLTETTPRPAGGGGGGGLTSGRRLFDDDIEAVCTVLEAGCEADHAWMAQVGLMSSPAAIAPNALNKTTSNIVQLTAVA